MKAIKRLLVGLLLSVLIFVGAAPAYAINSGLTTIQDDYGLIKGIFGCWKSQQTGIVTAFYSYTLTPLAISQKIDKGRLLTTIDGREHSAIMNFLSGGTLIRAVPFNYPVSPTGVSLFFDGENAGGGAAATSGASIDRVKFVNPYLELYSGSKAIITTLITDGNRNSPSLICVDSRSMERIEQTSTDFMVYGSRLKRILQRLDDVSRKAAQQIGNGALTFLDLWIRWPGYLAQLLVFIVATLVGVNASAPSFF
jgi:hypothetical protein